MNRISFCIITKNNEKRLPQALESIAGVADEVIVVDCGSTDRTQEIVHAAGVRVIFREWTDFADQKNFAAAQASNEWIFSLDADEALSEELRSSTMEWKNATPTYDAYKMARRAWYIGGWVKHSGWYPDYKERLYRKDAARFEGIVHEKLVFEGKAGRLSGDLLHYTIENFSEHEAKVELYAGLAAKKMFDSGKRSWRAAMWLATPWTYVQSFVMRAGFLDGHRGALIAQMAARSVRLKFKKLGEMVAAERAKSGR